MIFVLFFLFFLTVVFSYSDFKDLRLKKIVYVFLGIGLLLVAVFKDGTNMPDYQGFVDNIKGEIATNLDIKEPAFFAIREFVGLFHGYEVLSGLFIYALFGIITKLIAIRRLTEFWFVAIAIYISNYYMLHDLIQIRAGVASGFLLLCIKPLYERDCKHFLLFASIAFLFHYSAIVIFFLWFLNSKTFKRSFWLFAIPFGYFVYFSGIDLITLGTYIPISGIRAKLIGYQRITELGLNGWDAFDPFAVTFLVKTLVLYIIILNINKLYRFNKYTFLLVKIYTIALTLCMVLGSVPVVANRTKELLAIVEIVLFPSLIYIGRPHSLTKAIPILFSLLIMILLVFNTKLLNPDA